MNHYICKVMRFAAVVVLIALMGPSIFRAYAFGHYLFEYNRYVTELCENRDNVPMHCNGKCALQKNLRKTEAPSHKPSLPTYKNESVRALAPDHSIELFSVDYQSKDKQLQFCCPDVLSGQRSEIFHPPDYLA